MAMEIRVSLFVLVVLCSVLAEHSHKDLRGLSCVNDFVNNVSCSWEHSAVAPGADCRIFCMKKTWVLTDSKMLQKTITRSCKLKQHRNSTSGCSFVFENEEFNPYQDTLYIRVECNGTMVENLTNYSAYHHIKMHPPGVPNVSSTANETRISWSRGNPSSDYLTSLHFQVQIKQKNKWWNRSSTLSTPEQELSVPAGQLQGLCQVRVRVKPGVQGSHWSNWGPITSFLGATDVATPSRGQELLGQTSLVMRGVMFSLGVVIVTLVLYRSCAIRRFLKGNPVPNPSKYFHTLHSVHGGNLKKWLNPPSASEPFFTPQQCDSISPVDICESCDVVPSTSPSSGSTTALLHSGSHPSAGSDTSGVVDNSSSSSSSSSCFSNMGYFMSSSSGSSARTDPNSAYFTYREDFNSLNLRLSLRPSLDTFLTYESLKREPQSPDSGFGIGREDEDKSVAIVEEDEVSDDDPGPPLLILSLHRPSQMCPTSSAPPPPNTPTLTLISSDSQRVEVPVAAAGGSYAVRPLAGAMYRSSSMPVEPCKTGYLTLKELQATFSNKSI
ncbi:interleukin-2 receptor subunit beta [Cyclopterus lumpus]|uniref:Interleukin 2 receptor, beta n=1 Tax=Cyclopterus lumpus TaxID=8103 RepID=A0A8C3G072_CYCLU|nr:interleukin-2 receptor subunit beta [Cyclopterus lumpus]